MKALKDHGNTVSHLLQQDQTEVSDQLQATTKPHKYTMKESTIKQTSKTPHILNICTRIQPSLFIGIQQI